MLLASCSSVDYQVAGQFNYLSCENIAKASQDIFKKYRGYVMEPYWWHRSTDEE
jgi:hypothetical protein